MPRFISSHVSIPAWNLGKPAKTLNGGIEGPDPQAGFCVDNVQDTASSSDIGFEGKDGLKPGYVGIWALDLWGGVNKFKILGRSTREQVAGGLFNVLWSVEGAVIPGKNDLVSPYT